MRHCFQQKTVLHNFAKDNRILLEIFFLLNAGCMTLNLNCYEPTEAENIQHVTGKGLLHSVRFHIYMCV